MAQFVTAGMFWARFPIRASSKLCCDGLVICAGRYCIIKLVSLKRDIFAVERTFSITAWRMEAFVGDLHKVRVNKSQKKKKERSGFTGSFNPLRLQSEKRIPVPALGMFSFLTVVFTRSYCCCSLSMQDRPGDYPSFVLLYFCYSL